MKTMASVWLDRESRFTLQNQLVQQLKQLIQGGLLEPGEPLPSTRELAEQLRVSRNTVVYAYDRLVGEGYIETRSRSGVFVSSSLSIPKHAVRNAFSMSRATSQPEEAPAPVLRGPSPFRPCQPDVTLFPILIWNRLRGRVMRASGSNLLHYQAICSSGLPELRERLAAYLRDHRGVQCEWRQIAITAGSQQALNLLAQLIIRRGDKVYMEDPGYLGARLAWQHAGARIVSGTVDEQGLRLPDSRKDRYSLIYTTPSRQFPSGVLMSLARRMALIEYATTTKTWIIEDDYDSEFRFKAPPMPSLQSLDTAERVIYVGTFSKVLFPSLRLGYAVLPHSLIHEFNELKALMDDHGPLLDQATLALFLESGAFHSHIRRCRRAYAERQEVFLETCDKLRIPLDFQSTDGGMNLTGFFRTDTEDAKWTAALRAAGLDVPAMSQYAIRPTRPGLVFGFTAFKPDTIRKALGTVSEVLKTRVK